MPIKIRPESEYDPRELAMGVKIEMEHTDSPAVASKICRQHLEEFPDYYTRLTKMESRAKRGLAPNPLRLFHGTTREAAEQLLSHGWRPSSGSRSGNMGNPKYLYATTDPENARWFAEENGGDTVLEITGKASIIPDPEDSTYGTVSEELAASKRTGTPASFAIVSPISASQFKRVRSSDIAQNPPKQMTIHDKDLDVTFKVDVVREKKAFGEAQVYGLFVEGQQIGRISRQPSGMTSLVGWIDEDEDVRKAHYIGWTMEEAVKTMIDRWMNKPGDWKYKRGLATNPHQMAVDSDEIELAIDIAANEVYKLRNVSEWKKRENPIEQAHVIGLGRMGGGDKVRVVIVYAVWMPEQNWVGSAVVDPLKGGRDEEEYRGILINLQKGPSKSAIRSTIYHELIHIIFAIKSRVDKRAANVFKDQTPTKQQIIDYLSDETEFEARSLSLVHDIEDMLDKNRRDDAHDMAVIIRDLAASEKDDPNWLPMILNRTGTMKRRDKEYMLFYIYKPELFKRLRSIIYYSMVDWLAKHRSRNELP